MRCANYSISNKFSTNFGNCHNELFNEITIKLVKIKI